MPEIKILVEGYAIEKQGNWIASPSTVLIKDLGLDILADPGSNKELLLKALEKENLEPEDIDIVFLTHHHLDHSLNIRLFPEKEIYDGYTISSGDKMIAYSGNIPKTTVQVIQTPGHTKEHCSLLVKTKNGKIAVAGDVFWWRNDEKQNTDRESLLKLADEFAWDWKELKKSRKKLLEIADYIIPGHGKMFKVQK